MHVSGSKNDCEFPTHRIYLSKILLFRQNKCMKIISNVELKLYWRDYDIVSIFCASWFNVHYFVHEIQTDISHNEPKFLSKQCGPRSSLIRVYGVCHSACIFWTHSTMVKFHYSNFRIITANCSGVQIFLILTVPSQYPWACSLLFQRSSHWTPSTSLSLPSPTPSLFSWSWSTHCRHRPQKEPHLASCPCLNIW